MRPELRPELRKEPAQLRVFRNLPRAMPLFGAPHRPIAFSSHKSLCKRIRGYVLTGLLLFGKPNNLKFTQPAKVLIHCWLANKAKARLPAFSHNLHLDIYSISLTFSNMYQIPTCRLFENTRTYPSQITHKPPAISNRQREVALSIDADSHKKGGPVIQYTSHRKILNIHADSTKPLLPVTYIQVRFS